MKLYGLLTGHEEEAEAAFAREADAFKAISGEEATGKTVAFFYITSNGEANVRKTADYLPKMIELAGGTYIFQDLGDAGGRHLHPVHDRWRSSTQGRRTRITSFTTVP